MELTRKTDKKVAFNSFKYDNNNIYIHFNKLKHIQIKVLVISLKYMK